MESDMEKTTYELIQGIPDVIEEIDALIDPLFELGGPDNEVSERHFSNEYRDSKCNGVNGAVRMALELFRKLNDSRQILDNLRSVIPVLKEGIKKRDKELRKKEAELLKLQPIVDEVRNNTAAISKLSKELNKVNQGVTSELKSYSSALQKSMKGQKTRTAVPTNTRAIKTAIKEVLTDDDRKNKIILFGVEEDESVCLEDEVGNILLEIGQKPVVVQVVRLGMPTPARCRPVRVSLKSPDTVHCILKESPKLKRSERFSKVYISSDRTPEQRIKHKELVCEMKTKIQSDSSKHWKISKGEVVSELITEKEAPELDSVNVEFESPVQKKVLKEDYVTPASLKSRKRVSRSPMPVRRTRLNP